MRGRKKRETLVESDVAVVTHPDSVRKVCNCPSCEEEWLHVLGTKFYPIHFQSGCEDVRRFTAIVFSTNLVVTPSRRHV